MRIKDPHLPRFSQRGRSWHWHRCVESCTSEPAAGRWSSCCQGRDSHRRRPSGVWRSRVRPNIGRLGSGATSPDRRCLRNEKKTHGTGWILNLVSDWRYGFTVTWIFDWPPNKWIIASDKFCLANAVQVKCRKTWHFSAEIKWMCSILNVGKNQLVENIPDRFTYKVINPLQRVLQCWDFC